MGDSSGCRWFGSCGIGSEGCFGRSKADLDSVGRRISSRDDDCVTGPYTGERRISKTALGSLFGAGLGAGVAAGVAALVGKDAARAAMIGAGTGFPSAALQRWRIV